MHTLSHFQAKKKNNCTNTHGYIHLEREEKYGLFLEKLKGNFIYLLKLLSFSLSSFLFLFASRKQKNETVLLHDGTFGFSSSLKGRVLSEKGIERERGKSPTKRDMLVCV